MVLDGDVGRLLDIGYRCRVTQSSADTTKDRASRLFPALRPGGYFFRTSKENEPWFIVDLGRAYEVESIAVWNREDQATSAAGEAVPFLISSSFDGQDWTDRLLWTFPFGGRLTNSPLVLQPGRTFSACFLRVKLLGNEHLHLDYLEILGRSPKAEFGVIRYLYKDIEGVWYYTYFHQSNFGLYSGFSTILYDIIWAAHRGFAVQRIDLSMSFRYFKSSPDRDVYPEFFDTLRPGILEAVKGIVFHFNDVHKHYKTMPLAKLRHLASLIFSPSKPIVELARSMMHASSIDPLESISIVYRGTDKATEIKLAPIEDYIALARAILQRHPGLDVVVQTDQAQAQAAVEAAFPDCKSFADMQTTTGDTAIHLLDDIQPSGRDEFAARIVAAMTVLSRSRYLITHTGNMGAWLAFYRGSQENLYQFDAEGVLVEPDDV